MGGCKKRTSLLHNGINLHIIGLKVTEHFKILFNNYIVGGKALNNASFNEEKAIMKRSALGHHTNNLYLEIRATHQSY